MFIDDDSCSGSRRSRGLICSPVSLSLTLTLSVTVTVSAITYSYSYNLLD